MSVLLFLVILPFLAALIISFIMALREGKTNMNHESSAKYSFYYLLSLAALIFMALSCGLVLFSIINELIPDVLGGYNLSVDGQLKFAISALFIASPIFFFISSLINRGIKRGELDKDSGLRRWLTYFIILVSSLIILGVLIGVINNFLSGELTSRFVLKSVVVFLIAGFTFSFYFYDIRRQQPEKPDRIVRIFSVSAAILVLAIFVAAWFFVESPKTARARRLDQVLVQNVYNLENAINSYYERYEALPENLEELAAKGNSLYISENTLTNPEGERVVFYQKLEANKFELCANFRTEALVSGARPTMALGIGKNVSDHEAGWQCFSGNLYVEDAKRALEKK